MKHTKEKLEPIVARCSSMAQVLVELGLKPTGGNYSHIRNRLNKFGIDSSHFTGQSYLRGKTHAWSTKRELNEILVEHSTYTSTSNLKGRLLKAGLLTNICAICGQLPEWNGKPLVLQLDHINGCRSDNRLSNLRILCPHCHTQTETFSTRRGNPQSSQVFQCDGCGKKLAQRRKSGKCIRCIRSKN